MPYPKARKKKRAGPNARKRPGKLQARTKRKVRKKTVSAGRLSPSKVAVIADIHSNRDALEAVLNDIQSRGKDILKILCAGDTIGYGAEPNECCWMVQKLNIPVVQGNHDLNVRLKEPGKFNSHAQAALAWTEGKITQKNRNWLLKLPMVHKEKVKGRTIYMVHGSPEDPHYDYTTEHDPPKYAKKQWFGQTGSDIILVGHTHRPFSMRIGEKLIVNAGSVGQPRDGDPRASYALVDLETMRASIIRVPYNIDGAAEKIRKTILPGQLADRLYDGI